MPSPDLIATPIGELPPTTRVFPGEPCFGGNEYDRNVDGVGTHRFQDVYVVRDGWLAVYRTDLGLSFKAEPVSMTADGRGDSVAMVMEILQELREDNYWAKVLEEEGPTDWADQLVASSHEALERARNRSVFGRWLKAERNGIDMEAYHGRPQRYVDLVGPSIWA